MNLYVIFNQRLNVIVTILQVCLLYSICFEKFNLFLSPNIFIYLLLIFYILLLLIISKFKIIIFAVHPINLIALLPPFVLWFICIYYHDYSLTNQTLISFMLRFYAVGFCSFLIAKTKSFLSFNITSKLNILLLCLNLIFMCLSLKSDRNLARLTFVSISTTSSYILSVFSILVHISLNYNKNKLKTICQYIIYFLILTVSLLTQSRGGLLALLLVIILTIIYHLNLFKLNRIMQNIEIFLQKITLLSPFILFYPILSSSFSNLIINNFNFDFLSALIGREENLTTYLEEPRTIVWREYTNMFLSEPDKLIFGIGIPQDQLAFQSSLAETLRYSIAAHNYIYGSIAMGGVLYLISLLTLLFFLFKNMLTLVKKIERDKKHRQNQKKLLFLIKLLFFTSIINFVCMSSTDNFPYLFSAWPIHAIMSIFFFFTGFNSYLKSDNHYN